MKIETFIKFILESQFGIRGLIISDSFRKSRIIFNNLIKDMDINLQDRIYRRSDRYTLELNNKSTLDVIPWNENKFCGYRCDFIILGEFGDEDRLKKYILPYLMMNERYTKFVYSIKEERFIVMAT